MRRLLPLFLIALLAAPARAGRPLTPVAPDFPDDAAWVNARPLTLKRLRGRRAVLVAFINVSSVHALRALKMLKALDQAYSLSGLMVIGVHTPSFGYQKNPATIAAELRRHGVEFPVVLDNEKKLWKAYANEGWPGFYLVNHKGKVVWDNIGETRYVELETELRNAIGDMLAYSTPSFPFVLKDPIAKDCGAATPELEVGVGRSPVFDVDKLDEPLMSVVVNTRSGELSRKGSWIADSDGLRLDQSNRDQSAYVRVIYMGSQAFATLSPGAAGKARFFVRQDDLWLHGGNAGPDVFFDEEGRSYVMATGPRVYALAFNAYDSPHELTISPAVPGAVIYGFGFSDQCLKLE